MSRLKLTIKTLDSRNHPFEDLDPEMSIRELKVKISPSVDIPPERQRLIYCGRVLDDEKKLKDHALDGKVLHLVSRLPRPLNQPGNNAANAATTTNSDSGPTTHRLGGGTTPDVNITIHHAPPFRATAGGIGGGGAPLLAELPRSSATIRIQVASRMLRRANTIIDSLDNPGRAEEGTQSSSGSTNDTTSTTTTTMTTTSTGSSHSPTGSLGSSGGTRQPLPSSGEAPGAASGVEPPSDLSSLFSFNSTGGETVIGTMAIQIETSGGGGAGVGSQNGASSATASSSNNNPPTPGAAAAAVIVQNNEGLSPLQRVFQRLNHRTPEGAAPSSEAAATSEASATSQALGTSTATGTSSSTTTTPPSTSSSSSGGATGGTPTTIEHPPPSALAQVMEEYSRTNARLAPHTERMIRLLREDPELSDSVVREHQVFYNYVTQALHFMSHSQHAMSDILFNLSTPTPREIRARPFLLHRPAFQNVAISATATPTSRPPGASGVSQTNSAQQQTPTNSSRGTTASTTTGEAPSATSASEIGFTVEAQPIIVGIPSVRQGMGPGGNNRAAFIASETDFISNMIRATLGGIQNAAAAAAANSLNSSATATTNSSGGSNTRGQRSSSSEMNSGTQPTTSTRTRSSPHVHYAAAAPLSSGPSPGILNNFDPFLQCNSHHILEGQQGTGGGGLPSGLTGSWATLDHHPIRRRTRHPAGFQMVHTHHHGSVPPTAAASAAAPNSNSSSSSSNQQPPQQRSSSVPPRPHQSSNNSRPTAAPTNDVHRRALAQGIRELVLSQVMNPLIPPSSNNEQQQPPQQEQLFNDDTLMFNIIQGILRYFVGALDLQASEGNSSLNTVSTGNETMEMFLRSLPDYNYVEGESVLTDLLMTIIRNLTFRDLVRWIFGSGDRIINQLREPLAAFVRGQLVQSSSSSSDNNVQESVQRFLDSYYPQIQEISNLASLSPEFDFPETLSHFLSERLTTLVEIVLRENDTEDFGRDISREVSGLFTGLTALGMTCFTDGPISIERVVQNQLGSLCGHGLGPLARDQLMSIATGHLRNYIGGLDASSQEDVSRYIIKKGPEAERRKSERNKRIAAASSTEDERFETPPSSPEKMDIEEEEDQGEETKQQQQPPLPKELKEEEVLPVDPNQRFPGELLKMAQGPDMVIGSESWHKSLPSEWVPIITRDVARQQRSRKASSGSPSASAAASATPSTSASSFTDCIQESFVQAPFSDAYLSSQSAKRRKITASKKPDPGAELENVIAESLNEALSETGVMTLVDVETISGSPDLLRSVELKTKNVIKEKLSKDLDFANSPDNCFRSSKAFSSSKD